MAREVSGLKFCAEHSFKMFITPQLLHRGEWVSRDYAIYTPLPQVGRRAPTKWNDIYLRAWKELKETTEKWIKLNDLEWWHAVRDLGRVWEKVADFIVHCESEGGYEFCAVHGDFMSWNTRTTSEELWLFDWEEFSPKAPALVDPIHFILKYEMLLKRRYVARVAREVSMTLHRNIGRIAMPQEILLALAYWRQQGYCFAPHDLDTIAETVLNWSS